LAPDDLLGGTAVAASVAAELVIRSVLGRSIAVLDTLRSLYESKMQSSSLVGV
jgi:hypothetical protein